MPHGLDVARENKLNTFMESLCDCKVLRLMLGRTAAGPPLLLLLPKSRFLDSFKFHDVRRVRPPSPDSAMTSMPHAQTYRGSDIGERKA